MIVASKQRYLVDPVTKFVGLLDSADEHVKILQPSGFDGCILPAHAFISRNRDAVCVACSSDGEFGPAIDVLEQKANALDFWLMLLDPEIRDVTKDRIAGDLEELFHIEMIFDHVRDIMYSAPLPPSASLRFVSEQASGTRIRRFSRELIDAQPRIRNLFAIWSGMKSDPLVVSRGHRELTGHLVANSIYHRIVTEGKTQADVQRLIGEVAFKLAKVLDPRVVSKFLGEYKRDLPPGERRGYQESIAEDDLQHSDEQTSAPGRVTARKVHVLYQQAEREVVTIASLFAEGKDVQATEFLEQLVARQSTDGGKFVVKSLCNVASRVSTAGRSDVSLQLLQRAMEQSDGLDTILYLQIGNEFRDIREYKKALECYKLAKALDDGSKADGIRDEIIRVSVAKGEYEIALSQYRGIENIHESPRTLTGLGTLYRKMGDLRSSRDCYWSALDAYKGSNDVAHAGLAEASKQSGKLHRAIFQYQNIFKSYKDQLEPSSERVYKLALSQLFRLTQQYSKAESELRKLWMVYPLDHHVNLQLAKVCVLTGQIDQADQFVKRANAPDLTEIAADLFRLVMSKSQALHAFQNHLKPMKSVSITDYLPEDRGLAGCRNAVAAIVDEEFEVALKSLQGVPHVDRIHSDFATVLRFHSKRATDARYDYRDDQALCRILKRGFQPLRLTAQAIANNRLDTAVQQELRFCLLVA